MTYVRAELNSLLPPFLVGTLVIVAWGLAAFHRRRHSDIPEDRARATSLGDAFLALSILGVLLATLYGDTENFGEAHVQLVPVSALLHTLFEAGDAWVALRDMAFNVLAFVPFGFFTAQRIHRKHRIVRTVLAGIALSLLVETIQLVFLTGRTVDVNDVILNVLGTSVGGVAGWALRRRTPKREPAA